MTAAILGQYVINKTYERVKIKIAFHPLDERFEVQNPAILKDKTWLHDIADAINGDLFEIAEKYFELNPDVDKNKFATPFQLWSTFPKNKSDLLNLPPTWTLKQ